MEYSTGIGFKCETTRPFLIIVLYIQEGKTSEDVAIAAQQELVALLFARLKKVSSVYIHTPSLLSLISYISLHSLN